MNPEPIEVPAVYAAILELADALGVANIKNLPGCWEHQVDEAWWIAGNGHKNPVSCSHVKEPVKPFNFYVEYLGWPAGIVNPIAGIFAEGSAINSDTFLAALEAATKKARGK